MNSSPSPLPPRLSDTARTAASVVLAIYLVGLVLAIAGNTVSGSSALVRVIKGRLFSPWMQPAWLDLGFDHPLTYGMPEDASHVIEVRRRGGEPATLSIPGSPFGEGPARWRRLARAIAEAAPADAAAPLVAGVGAGSFAALAAEDVTVRVLRQPLEERAASSGEQRPQQVFAARVRRVAGELQVIELGGAAKRVELTPVIRPPVPSNRTHSEEAADE